MWEYKYISQELMPSSNNVLRIEPESNMKWLFSAYYYMRCFIFGHTYMVVDNATCLKCGINVELTADDIMIRVGLGL